MDDERKRIKHAEVLVPDIFLSGGVQNILVRTPNMAKRVNDLISQVGLAQKIPGQCVGQIYILNKKMATAKRRLPFFYWICYLLAHAAGHLQLDQAVEFDRVLHWEFFGDRLDEAVDDHSGRFGIKATAHQVEELVVTNLRDGGLVADFGLILLDTNSRIGIRASVLVEQERVTTHAGFGVVSARIDTDKSAIGGAPGTFRDRLRQNLGGRVRGEVCDLGTGILMHTIAGERHGEDITASARLHQ